MKSIEFASGLRSFIKTWPLDNEDSKCPGSVK